MTKIYNGFEMNQIGVMVPSVWWGGSTFVETEIYLYSFRDIYFTPTIPKRLMMIVGWMNFQQPSAITLYTYRTYRWWIPFLLSFSIAKNMERNAYTTLGVTQHYKKTFFVSTQCIRGECNIFPHLDIHRNSCRKSNFIIFSFDGFPYYTFCGWICGRNCLIKYFF